MRKIAYQRVGRLVDDVEGGEEGERDEQGEEHGEEAFSARAGSGQAQDAEGGARHGTWVPACSSCPLLMWGGVSLWHFGRADPCIHIRVCGVWKDRGRGGDGGLKRGFWVGMDFDAEGLGW